ncbi:hypothetical protein DVH24_039155 [Malus domestica]|uniref:Uncharacterized protein n=1 Tax=Malus domestica TaxID=3750 RepID=A0A498KBT1_MALDO|nr:hypothetical protein DVH24_039155 [Malus domestica]
MGIESETGIIVAVPRPKVVVNKHLTARPILLTRHGESKDNVRRRIGEDNPLRPVPLKEEVTTLRGQVAVHGEQGEEMKAYVGQVRDLVQAIQMSGLQISLPVPDLATPSTFEPFHSADTQ